MEKRILGKTKERLSIIGFGGIVVTDETASNASRYVSKAIDRGINYFDVAPEYGNAQEMLGPALKPYRKDVFLACKTHEVTAKGAEREFKDSLKKLKTDYFDLYQMHQATTLDEVKQIMGPGGALEYFIKAKDKGYVKYLGFTAHSEEAAIALMGIYDFTSILFPFNWALWFKDGFGPAVFKKAKEKEIGILALKALAKGMWQSDNRGKWDKCWYEPMDSFEEASLALRFTLSLPVTSAVSPSHAELLWLACDIADSYKAITTEEKEILKNKSLGIDTITQELLVPFQPDA
ncbi:MAG: aldo/keto reductase [Actinomycetia bacterium]|nr:aldo/keto reductase [Actinomycetes bacterium]